LVILSGAILAAGGAVAQALPAINGRSGHGEGALAALAGGFLVFLGLCLLLFGWRDADPRPVSSSASRDRDRLP
jgi:hypothetical protein